MTTQVQTPTPAIEEPPTPLLRRGEMMAWLELYGISRGEVRKCIDTGLLTRVKPCGGYGYFLKSEVQQLILDPYLAAERKLSK